MPFIARIKQKKKGLVFPVKKDLKSSLLDKFIKGSSKKDTGSSETKEKKQEAPEEKKVEENG